MSIGMTFVMVSGGIDLSTYTIVSAASVVGATAMVAGYSPLLGCVLMLAGGSRLRIDQRRRHRVRKNDPVHRDPVDDGGGPRLRHLVHSGAEHIRTAGLLVDTVSGKIFDVIPIPAVIIIVVAIVSGFILAPDAIRALALSDREPTSSRGYLGDSGAPDEFSALRLFRVSWRESPRSC